MPVTWPHILVSHHHFLSLQPVDLLLWYPTNEYILKSEGKLPGRPFAEPSLPSVELILIYFSGLICLVFSVSVDIFTIFTIDVIR